MTRLSRKGAVELSVGTIVILVIGMSMLVLGILLVRTIFTSAIKSVEEIDEGVENEINKLFADDEKRIAVRLSNGKAEISKGEEFNIAFGIRNNLEGVEGSTKFQYKIEPVSIERGCTDLTISEARDFLRLGYQETDIPISAGRVAYKMVSIQPSDSAPLCSVSYRITVQYKEGSSLIDYDQESFVVQIVS